MQGRDPRAGSPWNTRRRAGKTLWARLSCVGAGGKGAIGRWYELEATPPGLESLVGKPTAPEHFIFSILRANENKGKAH